MSTTGRLRLFARHNLNRKVVNDSVPPLPYCKICLAIENSMKTTACHHFLWVTIVCTQLFNIVNIMAFPSPVAWNLKPIIRARISCGQSLVSTESRSYQLAPRISTKTFMSPETTRTLAPGSHVSEMEVKKSRFLGYATHVEKWEDALVYIEQVKTEHPKARHWCYGFQCGINPVSERCSDDGEPTGTAGVPILGIYR